MEYSTLSSPLVLPDYGRNVHRMVAHALTITDRAERQRCAESIVRTMSQLHPELNNKEQQRTYYDHLALMAGFKLDIDYPYGEPHIEDMKQQPEPLPYSELLLSGRHYGKIIRNMLHDAASEVDDNRRKELIVRVAQRMRYCHLVWNKEHVDEQQVKQDIQQLSDGALNCDFPEFHAIFAEHLHTGGKKKKKK